MEFKFLHFYPDLMNLYGSYANVAVLKRHLEALGHTACVEYVERGQEAHLASADFVFMGAGTERSQKAALADFVRYGEAVKAAAENGTVMLFAGTAMDLLGKTITDSAGKSYEGIGLADFCSVQGDKRFVEDVYGATDLYPEAVVGFMNKCSTVTGVTAPLLSSVTMGCGNEGLHTPEGYHAGNVFASYLTGPILVKNPRLLDTLLRAMLQRKGVEVPDALPTFPDEEASYAVTAEQLRLRSGN